MESTLVIIKPDGYARGLLGEIISRFERVGLKVTDIRISVGESDLLKQHYPEDTEWLQQVGEKTLSDFESRGLSPLDRFGSDKAIDIGLEIRRSLAEYLGSGAIVPMIISGNRAIE